MKRSWKVAFLAALFALVSCGGQPPGGNGGGGSGNAAEPQEVAGVLGAANEQLLKIEEPLMYAGVPVPMLPFMPFSVGIAPLDTATWDCSGVSVSGNTTDADDDGVPVDATYNGRCTWSYSGSEGSASGYWEYDDVRVQDPNDHDPDAGVKVSGTIEWGIQTTDGSVEVTWRIVKHELIKTGNDRNFNYEGSWTIQVDGESYTVNYDMSGTWSPDDPDDPWGNGTMTASGSFSGTGPDCAGGWSVTFSLNALHFADCGIDGGSASYTVTDCEGHTCTLTVNWAGCNNVGFGGDCVGP